MEGDALALAKNGRPGIPSEKEDVAVGNTTGATSGRCDGVVTALSGSAHQRQNLANARFGCSCEQNTKSASKSSESTTGSLTAAGFTTAIANPHSRQNVAVEVLG